MHLGGARGRGVGRRAAEALRCPALGVALALAGAAGAEVELDGSIRDGPVPFDGTTWQIDERLGVYSGSNLFYSFSLFGIPEGQAAIFDLFDALATKPNFVIARVTGGASEIGGRIQSDHVGASLLLLNPSGFSFGPQSVVDVEGSLYVSTADVLRFPGGESFDARSSEPPAVLSADPPAAFGFLGDAPAGIAFDLDRTDTTFALLPAEATLGVVAGDVSILGGSASSGSEPTIRIEGGSIELAAVRSAGTDVPLDLESFDPGGQPVEALVTLGRNAHLDVQSPLFSPVRAGRVVIRGGKLVLDDALITSVAAGDEAGSPVAIDIETSEDVTIAGGSQLTVTSFSKPVGDLRIASKRVEIVGASLFSETQGDAVGGAIRINADSISVAGGSVQTSSRGTAVGGAIEIAARRELHVTDRGQIVSRPLAPRPGRPDPTSGPGGAIDVRADEEVVLTSRGKIFSEATGAASNAGGNVTVHAGERILVVGEDAADADVTQISALTSSSLPDGRGGNLVVSAPTVELRDGGQIRTTTGGAAPGGSLDVKDTGLLRIVGNATVGSELAGAGLFARVAPGASGGGGDLTVAARVVEVEDGGEISTRTLGAGNAGKLLIHDAERVSVRGGPRGAATLSTRGAVGAGGDLEIAARELELAAGGLVSASTVGAGDAGDLRVAADRIRIADAPSGLFSQTIQASGEAGDIVVAVGSWLEVRDGGQISVNSLSGGAAGDVEIRGAPGATVALVGGSVSARSRGSDEAGNVTIETGGDFVAGRGASVATDALGNSSGGRVAISAGGIFYASDARIETLVERGLTGQHGNGGDVDVPPLNGAQPEFSVLNRSKVIATAVDGNGGNIQVAAKDLLASQGVVIDATSRRGVSGTVQVTGPDENLAGQIVPLPSNFFDAAKLMTAACDARRARAGSFVVQTRTAIAPLPDAPLSPPVLAPVAEGPGGADGAKCPG